jgi:YgiT-type zinc finger domain-containing protein
MTTNPKNQRCAVCGGELQATTITHEEKRGIHLSLFQNVPAKVCATCGEIWIDEETLRELDRLIAEDYRPLYDRERALPKEMRVSVRAKWMTEHVATLPPAKSSAIEHLLYTPLQYDARG